MISENSVEDLTTVVVYLLKKEFAVLLELSRQ